MATPRGRASTSGHNYMQMTLPEGVELHTVVVVMGTVVGGT
jgi:hypothetical protein